MSTRSPDLRGAACADLPAFVVDKYFGCSVRREPLKAMVAKAICSHCPVRDACLGNALNGPPMRKGVVGGVPVADVLKARGWRRFEQGLQDAPPSYPRPEWLSRTDATETVEQGRYELDPDEVDAA